MVEKSKVKGAGERDNGRPEGTGSQGTEGLDRELGAGSWELGAGRELGAGSWELGWVPGAGSREPGAESGDWRAKIRDSMSWFESSADDGSTAMSYEPDPLRRILYSRTGESYSWTVWFWMLGMKNWDRKEPQVYNNSSVLIFHLYSLIFLFCRTEDILYMYFSFFSIYDATSRFIASLRPTKGRIWIMQYILCEIMFYRIYLLKIRSTLLCDCLLCNHFERSPSFK
jgi:hypothetical protein